MSRVKTSTAKLSDEIQLLNVIHVQNLNNLENEILLRNLYTNHLEEFHKELQNKVFFFKQFFSSDNQISGLKSVCDFELVYVHKLNKYFNLISK